MSNRAMIYEAAGAVPHIDRMVYDGSAARLTIVAVGHSAQVVRVAADLVASGVELIELCGSISLVTRALVERELGNRVSLSSVMFGIESIVGAAAYSAAYSAGQPMRDAFIFLDPGAAPDEMHRFVRRHAPHETTFAMVGDGPTAARIADELARSAVQLIELYGGFSTQSAAAVIEAVGGRVPVGVGSFALGAMAAPRLPKA